MGFNNRDVLAIRDFSKQDLLEVLNTAKKIDTEGIGKYPDLLKGKIMASVFFEPSTRTRLSFEAAMHRLGGSVVGFSESTNTSLAKGETLHDTIKTIDGYSDIIVIRHPEVGSAQKAAEAAEHPVINAGDGPNEHPTQTLIDLYTIMKVHGTLDNLHVGFLGDLKYGRTVHSLANALSHFNTKLHFISNASLRMPEKYLEDLKSKNTEFSEHETLDEVSHELDIIYVTRVQKERFVNPEEYAKIKYAIDKTFLKSTKPTLKILHPLPRVDEIDPGLDKEPQSIYFEQAHNGIPVRMALLGLILNKF